MEGQEGLCVVLVGREEGGDGRERENRGWKGRKRKRGEENEGHSIIYTYDYLLNLHVAYCTYIVTNLFVQLVLQGKWERHKEKRSIHESKGSTNPRVQGCST